MNQNILNTNSLAEKPTGTETVQPHKGAGKSAPGRRETMKQRKARVIATINAECIKRKLKNNL